MKKILFLNTTKLAVLSAMLLLAVFCTIGMSFTPAEEGENVGNPNDSTYVTGPRRSSSSSSSCNGTSYSNETDYGRVEVRMIVWNESGSEATIEHSTVGSVTLKGETTSKTTSSGATFEASISDSGTEGNTAYINWNSNLDNELSSANIDDEYNKACHTLTVTVTAIPIDIPIEGTVYEFYGWTKHIMQNNRSYDQAIPPTKKPTGDELKDYRLAYKDEIILGDVNDDGDEEGFTSTKSSFHITTWEGEAEPHTVVYYAHFAPPAPVEITLGATKNGSYTYTDGTQSGTINNNTDGSIETSKQITLTATPASGYKFFGWYKDLDSPENYLSYDATWSEKFTTPTTIYAKFIPEDAALFIIKDDPNKKEFWNLNEACEKARSFSNVVLPKENGTLYPLVDGELCTNPEGKKITPYTIPSGVTLLVPYDNEYTLKTSEPEVVAPANASNCKPYITLTLAENVTIDVNGEICVMTKQYATNTTYTNNGVRTYYGFIYMNKGSSITLNNEANLYCWGYISGDGRITANEGAKVYEMFQITDFRGGTRSTQDDFKTYKIFICQSYYMQNIETELICNSNAYLYAHYAFILSLGSYSIYPKGSACVVGPTNAMFTLQDNGILYRKYDRQTDRMHYILEKGTCTINNVSLTVSFATIDSKDYVLPINSNMTIDIKSGCNFILTQDMSILPNTNINIDKGAKVTINSGCNLYVYDTNEWIGKGCIYNNTDIKQLAFVGWNEKNTWGKPKERFINLDAKLKVNGELILNGNLYTTAAGADICSDGTGQIIFNSNAGTKNETYQDKNNNTYQSIPITAAQLHNDESKTWNQDEKYKYTQTSGAAAGDIFTYSETYGRWRCERTITWEAHGGTIEPLPTIVGKGEPLSLYFPESLPTPTRVGYTFNGWFTAASGGEQITIETVVDDDVTYYAQWTLNLIGDSLDIVDADGTYLTINANGWASSGWPYTVSVVTTTTNTNSYEKTARQSDRTLKVPYSGDLNADMQIIVTNTSGTVSNHIYKVPFVYTSDATLSGTDESSIVFVKSGTLTVGTASAKEIYVAPGAELKVNGTLTVGKLVLRTTPYKAAILTIENGGAIADGGQVFYSRISPDSEQYYQFGLPLSCPLASVQMSNTGKLGGSKPKYGTAWMLKSYNEESRANNGISNEGANWELLESTGTITAGVGYEMFSNSNYYREFYFPVNLSEATNKVSVQYTEGTKGTEHNGWNIITSPLTSRANVPIIGDPATAIKVCWLNEDGSYRQEQPTVIPPAIPFSYQASVEGELNFSVSTIAAAPRKQSAGEALTETEWVHLDIFDAYGEGDETSLFVHPTRFEQTYKTGIDMAKQSLTAARPIVYSTHAYGDMAFAGVADSLLENGIDLVVYSPAAQELTFSLRENKFLNRLEYLWLADNETGERTDLLMDDYTFRADAGTAKGRFVLNGRFKAPQIATGIGNTQTDYNIYAIGNNIAISGVEQGTPIYVFDAVGHMIYTTAATSDEVIVPAPCAGVYMLSVGGQTAKLVINQ